MQRYIAVRFYKVSNLLFSPEKKQSIVGVYWIDRVLVAFSLISTVFILLWLLKYSHFGLDFTDESFYLVWISNPYIYGWSLTQFGFIYHPLYLLLSGDIAQLRQANILITFVLGYAVVNSFMKLTVIDDGATKLYRAVVSLGIASIGFSFLGSWLSTPSYNSLTLQSLLIVAIGLLLVQSSVPHKGVLGWTLVGVGGWLAFMAKPSTASALGVLVLGYLILARKFDIKLMVLSVGVAVVGLVMSAFIIDGSIYRFIYRLTTALDFVHYLGGGHTVEKIIRLDDFSLNREEISIILAVCFLASLAVFCCCARSTFANVIGCVVSFAFVAVVFLLLTDQVNYSLADSAFHGLIIFSIPLAAIVVGGSVQRLGVIYKVPRSHWALVFAFTLFPYIYAFGTNGNYWQAAGYAGIFWVLAAFIFIAPIARESKRLTVFLPLVLATQALAVVLVKTGMEGPYRQTQALRLNNYSIEIKNPGSTLTLSQGYGSYLAGAKKAANSAGFQDGTPIIDLTGQSAGVLYALRALSIGQAWTIGGYPGSLKLAEEALRHVSCDQLSAAWLLTEPGGPRSIPSEILLSFGAGRSDDYEVVATWDTATGAGGYLERPRQELSRPTRNSSVATSTCLAARATGVSD